MLRLPGKRPVSRHDSAALLCVYLCHRSCRDKRYTPDEKQIDRGGTAVRHRPAMQRGTSMIRCTALALAGSLLSASVSFAQGLPPLPLPFPNFQGTPEEQRACRPDVVKMCKEYLGQNDNTVVLRCLQANKVRLSAPCHGVLAHYGQI
jgi:hypothetical protein